MDCNVEGCEEKATMRYVWAWGEEGACCDDHRAFLESKSQQLGRGISFMDESGRRDYSTPKLEQLAPEVGQLRMRVAELTTQLQERDAQIAILQDELARTGVAKRAELVAEQPEQQPSIIEGHLKETPEETPRGKRR